MNKKIGYMIIIVVVGIAAHLAIKAYALSSIDELQNQADQKAMLRAEYVGYINIHNITHRLGYTDNAFLPSPFELDIDQSDTYNLENIVKQHIEDCRSGYHDEKVTEYEKFLKESQEEKDDLMVEFYKGLLGAYGDC